jgi:hypothetical protein
MCVVARWRRCDGDGAMAMVRWRRCDGDGAMARRVRWQGACAGGNSRVNRPTRDRAEASGAGMAPHAGPRRRRRTHCNGDGDGTHERRACVWGVTGNAAPADTAGFANHKPHAARPSRTAEGRTPPQPRPHNTTNMRDIPCRGAGPDADRGGVPSRAHQTHHHAPRR